MLAESLVEQIGLLGVFIAGATPWLEAVIVIPVGIALGLPPVVTMVLALAGNAATIVLFAAGSGKILAAAERRRERKGKAAAVDARRSRAKRIFVRYGDLGMGIVGPLVIGTQFAAAVAVSLGASVVRASVVQTLGAASWGLAAGVATWAIIS